MLLSEQSVSEAQEELVLRNSILLNYFGCDSSICWKFILFCDGNEVDFDRTHVLMKPLILQF
jgi:hypothetical protein